MSADAGRRADDFDRYDALEIVCAAERMLERRPVALSDLARMLAGAQAPDVVAIDDYLGEAIDAIDPVLEPNGLAARKLLRGLRASTHRRAARLRIANPTVRRRAVGE
jgi:hypothetical protein